MRGGKDVKERAWLKSPLLSFLEGLLNFLYPPLCWGCRERLPEECRDVCPRCREAMQRCREVCLPAELFRSSLQDELWFTGSIAFFEYTPVVQELVHAFKYRGTSRLARFFAEQIADCATTIPALSEADALVPVPLHRTRFRERGYNQAEMLARSLALIILKPVYVEALRRIRYTAQQAKLSAAQRTANIRGAFQAETSFVSGRKLVLVDDVLTTGSTLNECARVLRQAGAVNVHALTLVRVEADKKL